MEKEPKNATTQEVHGEATEHMATPDAATAPEAGKRKKKPLWIGLAILSLCVAVFCFTLIGRNMAEQRRLDELNQMALNASKDQDKEIPQIVLPNKKTRVPNEKEIDFAGLIAQNEDVIGWIEVPGTKISYPLLSTVDNDYYLDHDFYHKKSSHGAIYLDIVNKPNLEDPLLVIYGHNMKDGTMFQNLHYFRDKSFFKNNKRILIYTPEGQLEYRVFATYERDDERILYGRDFKNPKVMRAYLDELAAVKENDPSAFIELDGINESSSIITLSTCVGDRDERRRIVHGVWVRPETPENNTDD
ncbi:class B sortase [Eubacteriales bacterium OttesenSCG-928-M02]|nr:class B sortase [Eubacteriales bacterium OttesenSCG-928-M02]